MYSDNETTQDLLGFDDEVHNVVEIVTNPKMLPVTVGVLGDWGSGKSSLLQMLAADLRKQKVVVVEFSPWRIETYDDAKTAFLSAVIEQVADHMPETNIVAEGKKTALEYLNGLRKRVRWMRVAGLAAKHIVTMTAPSLDDLDGLLKDDNDEAAQPSTESLSRDFRVEFEELIATIDAPAVVVLVDDLDRCLPEQVPDLLQAIRLFLSVKGTAFVLATDERIVRDAIRIRYPHASASSETDLPNEYLEKIVQVPVRIPPVGPAEAESYLNLLVAERWLPEDQVTICLTKAREIRARGVIGVSMNLGIAREALGTLPPEAERDFALIGRIAKPLSAGLKGNPRQLKRYMNALEIRWNSAARRGIDANLDRAVLAKLMVLEYTEERRYQDLYRAYVDDATFGAEFGVLEARARRTLGFQEPEPATPEASRTDGETASGPEGSTAPTRAKRSREGAAQNSVPEATLSARFKSWLEADSTLQWLALEPVLSGIDLAPYFELGRAALPSLAARARALPPRLQALLQSMAAPNPTLGDEAAAKVAALDAGDASLAFDAGVDRLAGEKAPGDLLRCLATVAATHQELLPAFFKAARSLPFDALTAATPWTLQSRLESVARAELIQLLETWASQDIDKKLGSSARQVAMELAKAAN